MILAKLLLLFALFTPSQQDQVPAASQPELDVAKMQYEADMYERLILDSVKAARIKYPDISPDHFDALERDIAKLRSEKVTDPTFRDDWNEFGEDMVSMDFAVAASNWCKT